MTCSAGNPTADCDDARWAGIATCACGGGCCLRCGALLCSLDESSHFNAYRHLSFTKNSKKTSINKRTHTSNNTPSHTLTVLQVIPVKGDIREVEAISQLLNSLGRVAAPISFEIAGTDRRRYLLVRCRAEHAEMVKGRLTVIYGNPEVLELSLSEDPLGVFAHADHVGTTRLHLRKPAGLPLRTYRELGTNDTIMPILSALYDLSAGEVGCVQVVMGDASAHLISDNVDTLGAPRCSRCKQWFVKPSGNANTSIHDHFCDTPSCNDFDPGSFSVWDCLMASNDGQEIEPGALGNTD